MPPDDVAIVIMAGGEATRFPGKLEREIDGLPLLLRVYGNATRTGWPVYVAGKGSFAPEIDARLECPVLVDRWPKTGPLGALVSACGEVPFARVAVLAGDQPNVGADVMQRLAGAWESGDDAVVAEHDGRIEPLTAIYARSAILQTGFQTLIETRGAMHAFVERIRTRRVPLPRAYFDNVNTPGDLRNLVARGTAR